MYSTLCTEKANMAHALRWVFQPDGLKGASQQEYLIVFPPNRTKVFLFDATMPNLKGNNRQSFQD